MSVRVIPLIDQALLVADEQDRLRPLKVGDTIYQRDPNRRVYDRKYGFGGGPALYAGHFTAYEITGETRDSWLCGSIHRKVNKKTMLQRQGAYSPLRWFTKRGMEDDIFKNEHGHKIVDAVLACDASLLRTIADMVGYTGHLSGGQEKNRKAGK